MAKIVKSPPAKIVLDDGREFNQELELIDLELCADSRQQEFNQDSEDIDTILAEFETIADFADDDYDDSLPEYRQTAFVPNILECPDSFPFRQNARILLGCCQNRNCGSIPCDGTCQKNKKPHSFKRKYK